ncbi:MAG TPA: haloacid dehalogenase type II [Streptosporangiaceae bacterium]|nr:haloacid dehalogenase type II [Streptosporangiaceae bacterium]
MKPMRLLLFDVFGTVVDWRSSLIGTGEATGAEGDWPAIVDDWRRAYQPALAKAREDSTWRDLDAVQRDTLDDCLERHATSLTGEQREALVRGWRRLRPWPDSRDGLERLRSRYLTATLSNGHVALLADLLKFGDLRFDAVLSAQLAASYKPDPAVYLTALDLLECDPGDAGMVAAHAGDLRAAAALGLRPLFIRRPLEWGPDGPAEQPPDLDGLLVAGTLTALADTLGC